VSARGVLHVATEAAAVARPVDVQQWASDITAAWQKAVTAIVAVGKGRSA